MQQILPFGHSARLGRGTGRFIPFASGRRSFLKGALAAGAFPFVGRAAPPAAPDRLKFLFMADHHVESDFVQSFGADKSKPVYECWKPGDHAALVETYRFINEDPFCRDASFALFGGDQINTGYLSNADDLRAEMVNYHRTLAALDLHSRTKGTDLSDMRFASVPKFFCRGNLPRGCAPVEFTCRPPVSRVIAIQGNHDTGVGEFYRECAFTGGDVRFITFFASYVGLPAPKGQFRSTASISDNAMDFIEREMSAAAADPSIRHIALVSHWAIAPGGADFVCPILDACRENKMNDNRRRLLALCERCGCDLYINGHEHNGKYPVAKVGPLSDVNCGTVTCEPGGRYCGAFAIVEILRRQALFHVYSRAAVSPSGALEAPPRRLFTREIPLTPLRA